MPAEFQVMLQFGGVFTKEADMLIVEYPVQFLGIARMKSDAPPLTGRQLLDLKSSISGIPADFEQYEKTLAMFSGKQFDPNRAYDIGVANALLDEHLED